MASNSTEYLRFSAYSLKELITRKLASETKFTDLIYEGSNLAVLIDIVCYMYQCMLYNLNNTASEAMWSDSLVYENINRLAKLVGYNPKGATTATAEFCCVDEDTNEPLNLGDITIPLYSVLDTGKTDENGKKIFYSTIEDVQLKKNSENTILFYNGIWRLYSTIFVSSGLPFLTLLLDQLTSNDEKQTYVPSDKIDVYVLNYSENDEDKRIQRWTRVDQGLFTDVNVQNGSKIYSSSDNIYNVRLNENKQYEITFGNGFTGNIPQSGASIYVVYLDSNGPLGRIDLGDVQDAKLKHDPSVLGISEEIYQMMFGRTVSADDSMFQLLKDKSKWQNMSSSTYGKIEESVDDIRRNAPEQFKLGNRLITTSDWEYYVKNRFKDNILDVKCQNNWAYISTFYRWLYNTGLKYHDSSEYYLRKNKLIKYDYKWSDSTDVNNVYLWIKTKNNGDIYKTVIDNDVQKIKVITQEPVYLTPINVNFAFCALDVDEVRYNLKNNDVSFAGNYLEITIDDNTMYANSDILSRVTTIIEEFFDESNFTLGAIVDNNKLTNKIFEIGIISRIRTVYRNALTGIERIFPGISFASWSADFIDIGDDVDVTTVSKSLEIFLFPKIFSKNLSTNIKIIRKSISLINNIQF